MSDTNVLVRYFTGTPREQYDVAAREIDTDETLWLSVVTIVETAHVLTKIYRIPRHEVVDGLAEFLRRENVHVCELPRQRVIDALALCRPSGRVNFADALIWARAAEDEAEVLTFDRRFPAPGIARTLLGS